MTSRAENALKLLDVLGVGTGLLIEATIAKFGDGAWMPTADAAESTALAEAFAKLMRTMKPDLEEVAVQAIEETFAPEEIEILVGLFGGPLGALLLKVMGNTAKAPLMAAYEEWAIRFNDAYQLEHARIATQGRGSV